MACGCRLSGPGKYVSGRMASGLRRAPSVARVEDEEGQAALDVRAGEQ